MPSAEGSRWPTSRNPSKAAAGVAGHLAKASRSLTGGTVGCVSRPTRKQENQLRKALERDADRCVAIDIGEGSPFFAITDFRECPDIA